MVLFEPRDFYFSKNAQEPCSLLCGMRPVEFEAIGNFRELMQATTQENADMCAMAFNKLGAVGDHDHGPVFPLLKQFDLTTLAKAIVAHGDHLIDEKAIELDDHRQGKGQAGSHTGRIRLHRLVQIAAQLGEILNEGNFVFDRGIIDAANEAQVVHAGKGALKAACEGQWPGNFHGPADRATGRVLHTTEQADERGFSASVPAEDAELFARHHPKADILQNRPLSPVNRVALGDIGNFNHLDRLLRSRGLMAEG